MSKYGKAPERVGDFSFVDLKEVMYYLYLPVRGPDLGDGVTRMPRNIECLEWMVGACLAYANHALARAVRRDYVYVSARKGWATPDNPLNRPGWHADGFGTDDLNFVWWRGPGTQFLLGNDLGSIPTDHRDSMEHFEALAYFGSQKSPAWPDVEIKDNYPEAQLYCIDPYVIHSTPRITTACWRQYVKVSLSRHRYNLENNSHNYLFDYKWPMHGREEVRNDTSTAQRDYA